MKSEIIVATGLLYIRHKILDIIEMIEAPNDHRNTVTANASDVILFTASVLTNGSAECSPSLLIFFISTSINAENAKIAVEATNNACTKSPRYMMFPKNVRALRERTRQAIASKRAINIENLFADFVFLSISFLRSRSASSLFIQIIL